MNKELKPCPFCGGKGILEYNITGGYYVKCLKCGAKTGEFDPIADGSRPAIEAWNMRVEK